MKDVAPKGWITDDQELVVVRNREDHDPCDVNGYPYKLTDLAPVGIRFLRYLPVSDIHQHTE